MAEDTLRIPVEFDSGKATTAIDAMSKALEHLEGDLKKVDPAASSADRSISKTAEAFKSAAQTLGGFLATGALVQFGRQALDAAISGERQAQALSALGPAYQDVIRATQGTVTAEQALQAQQSLVQSGLTVTGEQLAIITRASREYARATGTDTTQAIAQLTDALRGGEAEGLRRFGIAVQQGSTRVETFDHALQQLRTTQEQSEPASRTLGETTVEMGRAFTDGAEALAVFGSRALGLEGILDGVARHMRSLVTEVQELNQVEVDVHSQRQRNQEMNAAQTRHVEALRAVRGSLESSGIQGVDLPADISGLTPAQIEQVSGRLEAIARRLPNTNLSAADIARRQGEVGPYRGSGGFAALEDIARERGTADFAGAQANAPVDIASLALDIQRMRDENTPVEQPTAHPTTHATTTTHGGPGDDWRARKERDRLAFERGATEREEALEVQRGEKQDAILRLEQESAQADRDRATAREIFVTSLRHEAQETVALMAERQQADNELALAEGREEGASTRRATQLNEQRDALSGLITEVDARIAQATQEHRTQADMNSLLRERLGLQRSLTAVTREQHEAERNASATTRESAGQIKEALVGTAEAYAASTASALANGKLTAQGEKEALHGLLDSLTQKATVKALESTAEGIGALITAPEAAPGFFAAAGAWTAVALAAGAGTAATKTTAPSTGAGGSSSTAAPTGSGGSNSAAAGGRGGNVTINFTGGVLAGPEGLARMGHQIIQAVNEGHRQLGTQVNPGVLRSR